MILIKFNDSDVLHEVQFSREGNIITTEGVELVNESGFTTWRMDGKTQLGDFSDFTTVYRVLDNAVQYSNDGRVWIENENGGYIPPVPQPDPLERIAALEEQIEMLLSGVTSDE